LNAGARRSAKPTKNALKYDVRSFVEMTKEDLMRAPKPKKKRILVIEDRDDERDLLKLVFGEYDVADASDYDEGLRMAKRQYFDLYVLDDRMPGGTCIDFCLRIREFDPHTPILLYSGQDCFGDRSAALSAGAQAYFAKPIEVQEVLGTVRKLLFVSAQRIRDARRAEFVAIREELDVRYSENSRSLAMAAERRQRAVRKLLRLKAKNAFLNAGGARGDFVRLWPATYLEAALDWESAKRERSN
jgi:DNA-binding response OmpR family regulator